MSSQITFLPEVTSTNDVVAELIEAGAHPFDMVVAASQTAGRGRSGRSWECRAGSGLLATTYLHLPSYEVEDYGWVTLLAGVAAKKAIASFGLQVSLKWPNDLLIGQAKCGGILTELHAPGQFIVGVGINLTEAPKIDRPTACLSQLGTAPSPQEAARALKAQLEAVFTKVAPGAEALALYRANAVFDVPVRVHVPGGEIISGVAKDVDITGALILETDGRERVITCGDADVVKGA